MAFGRCEPITRHAAFLAIPRGRDDDLCPRIWPLWPRDLGGSESEASPPPAVPAAPSAGVTRGQAKIMPRIRKCCHLLMSSAWPLITTGAKRLISEKGKVARQNGNHRYGANNMDTPHWGHCVIISLLSQSSHNRQNTAMISLIYAFCFEQC